MANITELHYFFEEHYQHVSYTPIISYSKSFYQRYTINLPQMSCSNVMNIPQELRCAYVKQTKSCLSYDGFVNYLVFVECGKNTRRDEIFCCMELGLLIFYYLLCIAIVADQL